jgi:hypothetical protein
MLSAILRGVMFINNSLGLRRGRLKLVGAAMSGSSKPGAMRGSLKLGLLGYDVIKGRGTLGLFTCDVIIVSSMLG